MFTLQTLIPEIIIILSLAGIIFIIVKKFPEISKIEIQEKKDKKSILATISKSIINFCVSVTKSIFTKITSFKKLKTKQEEIPHREESIKKLAKQRPAVIHIPKPKEENKNSYISLRAKAELLVGKKEYKEAEKVYLELLKKDPKDIFAYKGLGKIYFIQQILNDAQTAYEQVVKLNPNDLEAQTEIFKIRNLKKDLSIRKK